MSYRVTYDKPIFSNPENGYCVIRVKTADTSIPEKARSIYRFRDHLIRFTATGYGLPQTDAVEFELDGEWEDTKYGYQLTVEHWREIVPQTIAGVRGYLASGLIKGIGEKTADAIVERFGVNALDILDRHPERLLEIKGITESKLEDIKDSYMESRVLRDLMAYLAPYKVTPKTAMKIHQEFGSASVHIVRTKPYELCRISGFGFKKVDDIALNTICRPNDPLRIRGALLYALRQSHNKEGHLFLTTEALCKNTLILLNEKLLPQIHVKIREVTDALYDTVMCGELKASKSSIYLPRSFEMEDSVARRVAIMLQAPDDRMNISSELANIKRELGITLSKKQDSAVNMVFNHNLCIITGPPGTGKTTILQVVIHVFRGIKANGKLLLAAPTGKASRRMAESTGISDAKTLHSAMGLISSNEEDSYLNSTELIDADFIIIDEFSMADMWLVFQLFSRLKPGTKLLLVGDANQLPSVGAGNVFREFISCGRIPVTVLDEIFRQSKDSFIAHNAKFILENNTELFYGNDFNFIKCKTQEEAAMWIQRLYLEEIAKVGIENVQILSPYREDGEASAEKLNEAIRDLVNPASADTPELKVGNRIFRVNDRVIQTKNKRGISNGDVGFVRSIQPDSKNPTLTIEFSDSRSSRLMEYDATALDIIELAYAMTVHKAMGSEYRTIIMPILSAHSILLYRNLVYTAITRAKQRVLLVGQIKYLYKAIHKNKIDKRNTWLGYRIDQYCQALQEEKKKAG